MSANCHQNGFCDGLGGELQSRLYRACMRLNVRAKQELLFDHSSRQVAIIDHGIVVSLFLSPDGKQKCAELLKPGYLLGVDNLFHPAKEQTGYMLALTDVSVCFFPLEVFQAFYQQSPAFTKAVLESLSARLHKSIHHLLIMHSSSSEDKVRALINYLVEEGVDTSYLTHEDIALLADLNRVTVTRAISALYKEDQAGQDHPDNSEGFAAEPGSNDRRVRRAAVPLMGRQTGNVKVAG